MSNVQTLLCSVEQQHSPPHISRYFVWLSIEAT